MRRSLGGRLSSVGARATSTAARTRARASQSRPTTTAPSGSGMTWCLWCTRSSGDGAGWRCSSSGRRRAATRTRLTRPASIACTATSSRDARGRIMSMHGNLLTGMAVDAHVHELHQALICLLDECLYDTHATRLIIARHWPSSSSASTNVIFDTGLLNRTTFMVYLTAADMGRHVSTTRVAACRSQAQEHTPAPPISTIAELPHRSTPQDQQHLHHRILPLARPGTNGVMNHSRPRTRKQGPLHRHLQLARHLPQPKPSQATPYQAKPEPSRHHQYLSLSRTRPPATRSAPSTFPSTPAHHGLITCWCPLPMPTMRHTSATPITD